MMSSRNCSDPLPGWEWDNVWGEWLFVERNHLRWAISISRGHNGHWIKLWQFSTDSLPIERLTHIVAWNDQVSLRNTISALMRRATAIDVEEKL